MGALEVEVSRSAARVRPGRRERAAARGEEEAALDEGVTEELLGAAETSLFRATAARANYLALDRPEVAFSAKELCRRMSAPRQKDRVALQRLCRYLLGMPRLVYCYRPVPAEPPLQVYADTDFAGCVHTRRSTSGGCATMGWPPAEALVGHPEDHHPQLRRGGAWGCGQGSH